MGGPDNSWTKPDLQAECKLRGITGYSSLKKVPLLKRLERGGGDKDLADNTVPELRQACGRRGLRSYGRLRKADLIGLLEDFNDSKGTANTTSSKAGGRKAKGPPAQRARGKEKEQQQQQQQQKAARKRGPLRSRAQERFDDGPHEDDTPGYLYIYSEPGSGRTEWKIGKTTQDPPERRMKQSENKNGKVYKLKESWAVPWCGYVERIVHLELDDFRVVPGKKMLGGGSEDGGTEWFRADIGVVEARAKLVMRMVNNA